MKKKWYAENSIYMQSVNLLLVVDQSGDQSHVGLPVDFTMVPQIPATICEPTLRFDPDEAQQIMNELWRVGIRPKDGSGAIAHTRAIQAHLDDMRTIAFNRLKIT